MKIKKTTVDATDKEVFAAIREAFLGFDVEEINVPVMRIAKEIKVPESFLLTFIKLHESKFKLVFSNRRMHIAAIVKSPMPYGKYRVGDKFEKEGYFDYIINGDPFIADTIDGEDSVRYPVYYIKRLKGSTQKKMLVVSEKELDDRSCRRIKMEGMR